MADYTDVAAADVVLHQLITDARCLSRSRARTCPSRTLGEMYDLGPDSVIGVGLPLNDGVWHNCAHVK